MRLRSTRVLEVELAEKLREKYEKKVTSAVSVEEKRLYIEQYRWHIEKLADVVKMRIKLLDGLILAVAASLISLLTIGGLRELVKLLAQRIHAITMLVLVVAGLITVLVILLIRRVKETRALRELAVARIDPVMSDDTEFLLITILTAVVLGLAVIAVWLI